METLSALNEQKWGQFGKHMLLPRGHPEKIARQRELLQACTNQRDFLDYMGGHLGDWRSSSSNMPAGTGAQVDFAALETRLSAREFFNPPTDTQDRIRQAFPFSEDKNARVEFAANDLLWARIALELVDQGWLEPASLATTATTCGPDAIRHALALPDDPPKEYESTTTPEEGTRTSPAEKAVDDCTRRVLRSICHGGPRGRRTIYVDFPVGRAWWLVEWARQMSGLLNIHEDAIRTIFSEGYYTNIAERMYSQLSVLSTASVFGGLVLFLLDHHHCDKKSLHAQTQAVTGKMIDRIANALAARSATHAIEFQTPEENRDMIQGMWEQLEQQPAAETNEDEGDDYDGDE